MGNLTYGAGVSSLAIFFLVTVADTLRSCCILLRNSTSSRTCLGLLGLSEPFSKMPSSSCNFTRTARKHRLLSDQVDSSLCLFIHFLAIDVNMSMVSTSCNPHRNLTPSYCMNNEFIRLCNLSDHWRACRCRIESRYKLTCDVPQLGSSHDRPRLGQRLRGS